MPLAEAPDIVLIEDDEVMGRSLVERFALEGWDCLWYKSAAQTAAGWQAVENAKAIVSDLRLRDGSGQDLFERFCREQLRHPFILITAYSSINDAVSMMREGLTDYWAKPFDIEEAITRLHDYIGDREFDEPVRLGHCAAMREIERMVHRLANMNTSVLLTGESGVGKEVVARLLHDLGPRASAPFVAVNCSAIPQELFESELFGYERGAFTGAAAKRVGRIEEANGGTLFLDETGDMPPMMQVKLLRVLQERNITRLGGSGHIPVNFRLVCATNRDLKSMVGAGEFREDLFYRINVVHMDIPPLRERGTDVLWLAEKLLAGLDGYGHRVRGLTPDAEQALLAYDFPGNVRELANMLERAAVFSESPLMSSSDLFPQNHEDIPAHDLTLKEYVQRSERDVILSALGKARGVVGEAAELLGISRKNLWEKMKKLHISKTDRICN